MMIKSVLLPLGPADAFKLFTSEISSWWPTDRRHTNDPESAIFIDPGGRFFERARDGREVELGRVLAWEERNRIELDFYIATGPAQPTAVEIVFVEEVGGTRVTVTHAPKAESESLWDERAPRYARSWEAVLAALVAAARNKRLKNA